MALKRLSIALGFTLTTVLYFMDKIPAKAVIIIFAVLVLSNLFLDAEQEVQEEKIRQEQKEEN